MTEDELDIRSLIERWVIWRDSGNWERFATVWHPDARMIATWFEGLASEFIQRSKAGWSRGVNVTHFLGGSAVDVSGVRALAQTKMSITQRLTYQETLLDVICTGRFYDFFEKRDGEWKFAVRQCIYENDRIALVEPNCSITLEPDELDDFPSGYRHLGYFQRSAGMQVTSGLPGRIGPEVEALYQRGATWLKG